MNLGSNVNFFLGLQSQLRVFHWQTKGYARHIAFGETYDALDDLIDSYVEACMGKHGRFVLSEGEKSLQLMNLSEVRPDGMVKTCIEVLESFSDELEPKDTDLLNLRDEMIQQLNRLNYLLTLE